MAGPSFAAFPRPLRSFTDFRTDLIHRQNLAAFVSFTISDFCFEINALGIEEDGHQPPDKDSG
jgi:hypothetical protein